MLRIPIPSYTGTGAGLTLAVSPAPAFTPTPGHQVPDTYWGLLVQISRNPLWVVTTDDR